MAEAVIAAQLRSPHVVQVFDVGVDPDTNAPFIAMELLEGMSLRDLLARSGPLTPAAVVRIVSQVARALTRAHELGIVHRDLKPANIFLVRDRETELALLAADRSTTRCRCGDSGGGDRVHAGAAATPAAALGRTGL